jgi:hypothetical protein
MEKEINGASDMKVTVGELKGETQLGRPRTRPILKQIRRNLIVVSYLIRKWD